MLEKRLVVNVCLINFVELQLQVECLKELVILSIRSVIYLQLAEKQFRQ